MRIVRRCDVDPSSLGFCQVEELPSWSTPGPGDLLVIAKKHMADATPFKVVVVMSEARANALRAAFVQPRQGCVRRRPISTKVLKNLEGLVGRCRGQGLINDEASAYLLGWSRGDWPKLSRPVSYSHLTHRCHVPFPQPDVAAHWEAPSRWKHVDLALDHVLDDDDSDAAPEEVPLALEE